MARSQSTLATELENLTPSSAISTGVQRLSQAYGDYMKGATAGAVAITAAAVDSTAVPAMAAAIVPVVGDSTATAAIKIRSGIIAFWAAMVAAPAAFFAGATAITPPAFPTLATALTSTFNANLSGSEDLAAAAAAVAADIHPASNGGTATIAATPTAIL